MKGDTDKEWSDTVAGLIASDLIDAGVIVAAQNDHVREIIAKKLLTRLQLGDRPESDDMPKWKNSN
jgi:hypothetical protein